MSTRTYQEDQELKASLDNTDASFWGWREERLPLLFGAWDTFCLVSFLSFLLLASRR